MKQLQKEQEVKQTYQSIRNGLFIELKTAIAEKSFLVAKN